MWYFEDRQFLVTQSHSSTMSGDLTPQKITIWAFLIKKQAKTIDLILHKTDIKIFSRKQFTEFKKIFKKIYIAIFKVKNTHFNNIF